MYKESEPVFRTNDGTVIERDQINKIVQPAETLNPDRSKPGVSRLELYGRAISRAVLIKEADSIERSPINAVVQPAETL